MKKSIWCSLFCTIILLISRVFAVEYMDINVYTFGPGFRSVVLRTRKGKEKKYVEKKAFWACGFSKRGESLDENFNKFLDAINGKTIASSSPMYKSLKDACIAYDKLRYADDDVDFENNTIYLFDYSPDNEHFQTIIKNLRRLSKSYFNLSLLHSMTIR